MAWNNIQNLTPRPYTCGHCSMLVGAHMGWAGALGQVYVCPHCDQPTYFRGDRQVPGPTPGNPVGNLPKDIAALYDEAREAVGVNSYTAAVLTCRKLLMNIAVGLKAPVGQRFIEYVEYLAQKGYVPPDGKGWVDHIRKKGNDATHEIVLMSRTDAEDLIAFTEMLLKFIYEFPSRVPKAPAATKP